MIVLRMARATRCRAGLSSHLEVDSGGEQLKGLNRLAIGVRMNRSTGYADFNLATHLTRTILCTMSVAPITKVFQ